MRIFTVAQRLHPLELQGENGGELHLAPLHLLFKIPGDQTVIARRVLKDLHRQFAAQCRRDGTSLHGLQYAGVIRRVDHDEHILMVFCGGAQHGGTADVDVLDRLLKRTIGLGDRRFEGIQIHHDHIDVADAVLLHLLDVVGNAPTPQQTAVNFRMQRFHAAVENLRRPRIGSHIRHRHTRITQGFGGSARGQYFRAKGCQPFGHLNNSGLVRNTDQCPRNAGHDELLQLWISCGWDHIGRKNAVTIADASTPLQADRVRPHRIGAAAKSDEGIRRTSATQNPG